MRRSQAGFTLTELAVVLAILGILSLLIVSVSTRRERANARNTSEQLVGMIQLAKLRASATRQIHRVQIEHDRVAVWQATTTGLAVQSETDWRLVQTQALRAGLEVWDATAGAVTTTGGDIAKNAQVAYSLDVRPDGQATASTIYLGDGVEHWRVVVYGATAGAYAREGW